MPTILPVPDLTELKHALHRAWGPDTCAPEDRVGWTADNPSRGQCITTVLVVHDVFGGALVRGEVKVGDEQVDFHWWNRLPDGTDLDLTKEQFTADEHVVGAVLVDRPTGSHRVEAQYAELRRRVVRHLGCDETA